MARKRRSPIATLFVAAAVLLLLLEATARHALGNAGSVRLTVPSERRDLCFEPRPGASVWDSGRGAPLPPVEIQLDDRGARVAGTSGAPLRLLVAGDEWALGEGTPDGATLGAALGNELARRGSPVAVSTVAVPGYSPQQAVLLLEARAQAIRPDVAVLVVSPLAYATGHGDCPHRGVLPTAPPWHPDNLRARAAKFGRLLALPRAADRAARFGLAALTDPGWRTPPGGGSASTAVPGDGSTRAGKPGAHLLAAARDLGLLARRGGFLAAVAVLAPVEVVRDGSGCMRCPEPSQVAVAPDVRLADLAATWKQMDRQPEPYFRAADGQPTAEGWRLLGEAAAAELSAWPALRDRVTAKAAP